MAKLTKEQLESIAADLIDTHNNVFDVAGAMGILVEDDVFDQLNVEEGIFKCEECNLWRTTEMQSEDRDDCCIDCE